jgi:hypothetical protein
VQSLLGIKHSPAVHLTHSGDCVIQVLVAEIKAVLLKDVHMDEASKLRELFHVLV